MATPSEADGWQRGDVIADKYVVEEVIGDGGMGTIVKALHRELDEFVAIKLVKAAWLAEPAVLSRFSREARAVAKLKGEHVARVLDVGKTAQGVPFMVMEYLEGDDLGAILRHGPASIQDAVDWIIEACDALGEAHTHQITHRDIKPENLFLVQRHGRASVKLLDFGISKTALGKDDNLHETSRMLGTPLYMSPEQVRASASTDHRSDIWALGAVLYELLAGVPPFVAETLPEVCAMILEDIPPGLSQFRTDVPPELEQAVFRCLAKRPEERFQSVAEMAIELLPLAHPRQHATVEHLARVMRLAGVAAPVLSSVPPAAAADRLSLTGEPARAYGITPGAFQRNAETVAMPLTRRKRRWALPLALLALLVAATGITLALWRSPATKAAAPPTPTLAASLKPRVAAPLQLSSASPLPSAPDPGSSPSPGASAPTAPTGTPSARRAGPRVAPRPAPRPKQESAPSSTPPPAKPKLEIRMER